MYENYQKALRFAKSLMRIWNTTYTPRDLVHDAYLSCKGDEQFWIRAIHLKYLSHLRKKYTIKNKWNENKESILKKYVWVNHTGSEFGDGSIELEAINNLDIDERNFMDSLSKFDRKLITLRDQGYSFSETEKLLNTNNFAISKALKRIRIMYTNSPFNGSKLQIVERIKRKEFEANKEKYLSQYGKEGDYDCNECYEQFPSKTNPNEGLLVKEKDSD